MCDVRIERAVLGCCCLVLACASAPASQPAQSVRPELLPLKQRCDLLASVLTAPHAHGALSIVDSANTQHIAQHSGKLAVAATLKERSTDRSLFAPDEHCGDALSLVAAGPGSIKLTLSAAGEQRYAFQVSANGAQPETFPQVAGTVEANGGAWDVTFAGAVAKQYKPRPLDAAPVQLSLSQPLAAGQARAGFWIDTGRDRHDGAAMESGLVVIVRYGDREYRQTIASCTEAARGSALSAVTARVLDTAVCGAVYRVLVEDAAISVERETADGTRSIVTRIAVPNGSRTASLEANEGL
jgi:hypothetical protein